jgi:signal transduction histidine kinase
VLITESPPSERAQPAAVLLARAWLQRNEARVRLIATIISVVSPVLIGIADQYNGDIQLSVLYVLPIVLGTWVVGLRFGIALVVLSAGVQLVRDLITTVVWSSAMVPLWNAAIRAVFYSAVILLVTGIRELQNIIEARVQNRTQSLRALLEEHRQLEREMLDISDREQRRIGNDLHDGLAQHLTGTVLTGAVLLQKLEARDAEEASDARKVVRLIEDAISLSRNVARGLNPVELHDDALMYALREFSSNTSKLFNITCLFKCDDPVLMDSPAEAVHLFRIAQESVSNAIRHGKAKRIVIALQSRADGIVLNVEDDGIGIPQMTAKNGGMGLRIMAHRANLIDAALVVERGVRGGTVVRCIFPQERMLEGANG